MIASDEIRAGLVAELGPSPSFVSLVMVDAAVSAAEQLQATKDPQWRRVFTERLQRLHLTNPQRPGAARRHGGRPLARRAGQSLRRSRRKDSHRGRVDDPSFNTTAKTPRFKAVWRC